MEYIKKEELIKDEIYKNTDNNIIFKCINDKTSQGIGFRISNKCFTRNNWFSSNPEYLLATPEEKHWLNCCITADKFIIFEEAMKTFIPEYVECIRSSVNGFTENKIYKIEKNWNDSINFQLIDDNSSNRTVIMIGSLWQFKPSTKEAYDAQFVVKEPEFVLPEKWCVKTTLSNKNILQDYLQNNIINYPEYLKTWEVINDRYFHNKGHGCGGGHSSYRIFDGFIEITFEQFEKYVLKEETIEEVKVIEPLPQFKVIESIETITKVENNEGNQFFIGDVVKSSNGVIQTITSFNYNKAKTNIIAFTNKQSILGNGIGIDKIEHYIEPKTDYKILEYKTEGGISCKAPFLADSHQFYINERCKIYSIKRISDDLIITVGDEVLSKTCGVPNKILSIELINNKIRLYPRNSFYNLEDIIKVKEETLLEKAKRLYSIGTKFRVACNPKYIGTVKDHKDYPFQDVDIVNLNTIENIDGCTGMTVFYKGKWAEIINE